MVMKTFKMISSSPVCIDCYSASDFVSKGLPKENKRNSRLKHQISMAERWNDNLID